MARVSIEAKVWGDPRFTLLASLAGWANAYEAVGRMAKVWLHCTETGSDVVSAPLLAAMTDTSSDSIGDIMEQSQLGSRTDDGGIRIHGCAGRIEWLSQKRAAAKAGGQANRKRMASLTGSHPDSHPDSHVGRPAGEPNASPPTPTPTPTPTPAKDQDLSCRQDVPVNGKVKSKPKGPTAAEVRACAEDVIPYLNEQLDGGQHGTGTEHTLKLLKRWLARGFTAADMRLAIRGRVIEWGDDEKMRKYIRPKTVLSVENFEEYLAFAREGKARQEAEEHKRPMGLLQGGGT